MANGYEAIELAEAAGMDLSGLDASPAEVAAVLDAISEAGTYAYDGGDLGATADRGRRTFDEMLAGYEADTHLPGPELAGAGGEHVIDLAAELSAIDVMLAGQADREATRRAEDAAGRAQAAALRGDEADGRDGPGSAGHAHLRPGTGHGPG